MLLLPVAIGLELHFQAETALGGHGGDGLGEQLGDVFDAGIKMQRVGGAAEALLV